MTTAALDRRALPPSPGRHGIARRLSDAILRRRGLLLACLLIPPLLWLGIIYLGALFTLLAHSLFSIDEFAGTIIYQPTLKTFGELLRPANLDIVLRTVGLATVVTLLAAVIGFPVAWYAARHARGRAKALFYLAVMMPLWSSYLVKLYAWKLLLAKEGAIGWVAARLGLGGVIDAWLSLPLVGGPSLSVSYTGMVLVFLYLWLPFMILPIQAALERVPRSMLEASSDLGARPGQTFRTVVLPLAMPGVVAGAIFTFSLTLGDYIVPQVIGTSALVLGQAVYMQQGVAGNLPLAAAFAVVPIVVMVIFLTVAKRMGAFDAV
ncbi:ABC transporter permease [Tistrella bauzanensis]|uniref:ABC transporter permease n=1 Tax=Tistrella arctica TaxID=3133430 RepID=A0ABU9YJ41_9PROT